MARLFAKALHREIQPLGLAPAQFMVLLELWEDDGLTQRQLTGRLDVEQATMANTLARMERDGLIRRDPSPTDKRARLVWLSEKAKGLQGPATNAAQAVNSRALAGFSDKDRAAFLDAMVRVIGALQRTL